MDWIKCVTIFCSSLWQPLRMLRISPHTSILMLCLTPILLILELHIRVGVSPLALARTEKDGAVRGAAGLAMDQGGGTIERVSVQPLEQQPLDVTTEGVWPQPAPNMASFRAAMARRASVVARLCAKNISQVTYNKVLKNLVADVKKSILFCPIFKSASTSMLIALLELNGRWRKKGRLSKLALVKSHVFPKLSRFNEHHYRTRLMVVRHPLERLLSCYRDKFENFNKAYYRNVGKEIIQQYRQPPPEIVLAAEREKKRRGPHNMNAGDRVMTNFYNFPRGPTFSEFVQYVVSPTVDDEHWVPYHQHCAACSIDYNFILRMENFSEESSFFMQHLNASESVRVGQWNTHVGPSTMKVSCSYYSQLSINLFKRLVDKYAADFILYGYSPDEYLDCD